MQGDDKDFFKFRVGSQQVKNLLFMLNIQPFFLFQIRLDGCDNFSCTLNSFWFFPSFIYL